MILDRPRKYSHVERTFFRGNLVIHLITLLLFVINFFSSLKVYILTKEFASPSVLFIFFTVVIFILVNKVKTSRIDPNFFVPEESITAAKQEAVDAMEQKRTDLFSGDVSILNEGSKSEVLSIWKLDRDFRSLHYFFGLVQTVTIDPVERTCAILLRFQKSPIPEVPEVRPFVLTLFRHFRDFLNIAAADRYLKEVEVHFDTLFIVFDFISFDDMGFEHRHPFLSYKMLTSSLASIAALPSSGAIDLSRAGEMRFDDGKPVEPHHTLDELQHRGK